MDEKRKRISEQAYYHWEREGRPAGRERDHWLKAESEVDRETVGQDTGKAKTPRAAKAAKQTATKTTRKKAAKRAVKKKAK